MATLRHDLTLALRQFRRQPGFALTVVATMALGIGANTAVFSFVHGLLLRPLPFPEANRLVRVESLRGGQPGKLMPREMEELVRATGPFAEVAAYYPTQYNLAEGGPPEAVPACLNTASLFRVLGLPFVHGGAWPDASDTARQFHVAISHGLWKRRYGSDPAIVGKTILMDTAPYTVEGVLPPDFAFPTRSEVHRSINLRSEQNRDVRSVSVVARLRRGATLGQAQTQADVLAARLEGEFPETNRGVRWRVRPLREAYVGDVRPYLWLTLAMVVTVLLVACANVANLLLSRALARRREAAVRLALGAPRATLVRQLLTESLLLTLAGGLAGVGLAVWWVRLLGQLVRVELPSWLAPGLDPGVLVFAALVTVAAGLLAGLLPAWRVTATVDLQETLRDGTRAITEGGSQRHLRDALVVAEMAAALALLVGAGLLLRSFERLQAVDMGFRTERLLTVRVDPPWKKYGDAAQTSRFYREVRDRLAALPGVEAVASNQSLPPVGNDNYAKPTIEVEGQPPKERERSPYLNLQVVSPGYFEAMGIPLRAGRGFTVDDRESTQRVAVIGEPLARRLFGGEDPLRRRVRLTGLMGDAFTKSNDWVTVVGVAGPVRSDGLLAPPGMDFYLSDQQQFAGDTYLLLRTRQALQSLTNAVIAVVQRVDPEQPVFDAQTMEQRLADTVWQRRVASSLCLLFGGLALALATIGTYSVIAYMVGQRMREIGIRTALGATPRDVTVLVLTASARLSAWGIGLGLLCAAGVALALRGLLFGVSALDPATFVAVPLMLAASALLACLLPAWRAVRLDPAGVLRGD